MALPVVIGLAGGSGSGKTTLAARIARDLSGPGVATLSHDAYYLDRSDLTLEERARINYDHPSAFDNELLLEHMDRLLRYEEVARPVYSFVEHTRTDKTVAVRPSAVILLEGILVLENPDLRSRMNIRFFVDCDEDERLIRRLRRDIRDRGRTIRAAIDQYLQTVKPMHEQFVEPSKRYADVIVPRGGHNQVAIDLILARIRAIMNEGGRS